MDRVNAVKRREPFRLFSPVVLEHRAKDFFELVPERSSYMQFVGRPKDPIGFSSIAHVDGTSRVQTVSRADNRLLYDLLKAFDAETGCSDAPQHQLEHQRRTAGQLLG